ncbi:hypothetical protein [Lactiplantibacillus fabifermentans]|uniref:Integral membrane protein n=2 Tax=Lactiplantibacillus fabifermentans TaxID=483011 RepID=A0A0R2NRJ0_9LACO|nr:hypothetical protein [Lactiplantibacillus fabifermentans]ETY74345.1 hypothetical protein LFAB_07725 [Lactiplantibacillus fabifermentans T30PCM01]KRO28294.1 hypothetical protein DY78_GL002532 [Lactiplantibacillus fabifermentans DSM 21115]
MFTWSFWILAVWFVVNAIWMWFDLDNQPLQKTFAWINVVAVIWGFWAFYGATSVADLNTWFQVLNWLNVILAATQFYFGYRKSQQHKVA